MLYRWESNPRVYVPSGAIAALLVTLGLLIGAPGTREAITEFLSSLPIPSLARGGDEPASEPLVVSAVEQAVDARAFATQAEDIVAEPASTAPSAIAVDDHELALGSPTHRARLRQPAPAASAAPAEETAPASTIPSIVTFTEQTVAAGQSVTNGTSSAPEATITLDEEEVGAEVVAGPAEAVVEVSGSGVEAAVEVAVPLTEEGTLGVGAGVGLEGPAPTVEVTVGETSVEATTPALPLVAESSEEPLAEEIVEPLSEGLGGLGGLFG